MTTTITRKITLDAGHRVPGHKNKCRNLHGHTYTVLAEFTCDELAEDGAAEGMVADFGCVKGLMMEEIHDPCDHGMVLWINDTMLPTMLGPTWDSEFHIQRIRQEMVGHPDYWWSAMGIEDTKLYIVQFVPTAENLARHWHARMQKRVQEVCVEAGSNIRVKSVTVWETPNCFAKYEPLNG